MVEIDGDLLFSAKRLSQIKETSIALLDAAGLEASAILATEPGGSALRDKVLNSADFAPDSREGLAARIVELCIRIEHFTKEGHLTYAAGDAFKLGQLLAYAKVYASLDAMSAKGGQGKKGHRDPFKAKLDTLMRKSKAAGTEFDEFLEGWLQEGIRDGLRISGAGGPSHKKSYRIEDENALEGDRAVQVRAESTMRKDHSKA